MSNLSTGAIVGIVVAVFVAVVIMTCIGLLLHKKGYKLFGGAKPIIVCVNGRASDFSIIQSELLRNGKNYVTFTKENNIAELATENVFLGNDMSPRLYWVFQNLILVRLAIARADLNKIYHETYLQINFATKIMTFIDFETEEIIAMVRFE